MIRTSLIGTTNEEKIWNFLKANGLSDCGAAGLMGNLYAESGLRPNNLQNNYEGKLGMTDAEYTELVDKGAYKNFANDWAGYGLAQWTHPDRKPKLLAYAKASHKSIGDLSMQLNFLMKELTESFPAVLSVLKKASTVREASDIVLLKFEIPDDRSDSVCSRRAECGQKYLDKYTEKGVTAMTENQLRQNVVSIINGWIGAAKGTPKHLEILSIYNNYKPLARGYKVQVNDAYCATTVSAAYIKAGIAKYVGTECGVGKYIDIAKAKGIWVENDAYIPQIGDACVYDWDDNGVGDCIGAGDHIGIVTKVVSGSFTVTEGNMSGGKVGTRSMRVNGRYIRGFICPKYAEIVKALGGLASATTPSTAPVSPVSTVSASKEVKAKGKASSFSKALAGTYIVTAASGLYLRDGAGTNHAKLTLLPKGTRVQNYGYYTALSGVNWLYIQVIYQGVKYTGFSSAQYLKKA